nr:hypothetical protein [Cellulomonas sp. Y8]
MTQHLRRTARELDTTIVVVLHDIDVAGHYADLICAVKDGQVLRYGPPSELFTDEVLTRVFETPARVMDGPSGPLTVYY